MLMNATMILALISVNSYCTGNVIAPNAEGNVGGLLGYSSGDYYRQSVSAKE